MKQNLTNHLTLILDASSSMSNLKDKVVEVVDKQVHEFARLSKQMDQETRITIWQFADPEKITCLVFDMDVMRYDSIKSHYKVYGNTALLDAVQKATTDASTISTLHSDHAFLFTVVTDGQENRSRNATPQSIKELIFRAKENFTYSILVPDQNGVYNAEIYGFPVGNIQVWDATSQKGVEEVGDIMTSSVTNYMAQRSLGVRGSTSFFQVQSKDLKQTDVLKASQVLNKNDFYFYTVPLNVAPKTWISKFVESRGINYKIGKAFYQLTKPEKIQANKSIILYNKTKNTYHSGPYTRQLINLPDYEVKVSPGDFGDWLIYVQSTSVNRHIVGGSGVIVLK